MGGGGGGTLGEGHDSSAPEHPRLKVKADRIRKKQEHHASFSMVHQAVLVFSTTWRRVTCEFLKQTKITTMLDGSTLLSLLVPWGHVKEFVTMNFLISINWFCLIPKKRMVSGKTSSQKQGYLYTWHRCGIVNGQPSSIYNMLPRPSVPKTIWKFLWWYMVTWDAPSTAKHRPDVFWSQSGWMPVEGPEKEWRVSWNKSYTFCNTNIATQKWWETIVSFWDGGTLAGANR